MTMAAYSPKDNNLSSELHKNAAPAPMPRVDAVDRVAAQIKALLEEGNLDTLVKLANFANQYGFPQIATAAQRRLDEEIVKGIESGKIDLNSPIVSDIANNPELEQQLHRLLEKKAAAEKEKVDDFIHSVEAEDALALAEAEAAYAQEYNEPPVTPSHNGAPIPGYQGYEGTSNNDFFGGKQNQLAETSSPTSHTSKPSFDEDPIAPSTSSSVLPTAPLDQGPSKFSSAEISEDPINIGCPDVGKSMALFSQAMGGSAPGKASGPDIHTPDPV